MAKTTFFFFMNWHIDVARILESCVGSVMILEISARFSTSWGLIYCNFPLLSTTLWCFVVSHGSYRQSNKVYCSRSLDAVKAAQLDENS